MGIKGRLGKLAVRLTSTDSGRDLAGLKAWQMTDDELVFLATQGRVRRAVDLTDEELLRIIAEEGAESAVFCVTPTCAGATGNCCR